MPSCGSWPLTPSARAPMAVPAVTPGTSSGAGFPQERGPGPSRLGSAVAIVGSTGRARARGYAVIRGEGTAVVKGVTPDEVFDFVLDPAQYTKADTKIVWVTKLADLPEGMLAREDGKFLRLFKGSVVTRYRWTPRRASTSPSSTVCPGRCTRGSRSRPSRGAHRCATSKSSTSATGPSVCSTTSWRVRGSHARSLARSPRSPACSSPASGQGARPSHPLSVGAWVQEATPAGGQRRVGSETGRVRDGWGQAR